MLPGPRGSEFEWCYLWITITHTPDGTGYVASFSKLPWMDVVVNLPPTEVYPDVDAATEAGKQVAETRVWRKVATIKGRVVFVRQSLTGTWWEYSIGLYDVGHGSYGTREEAEAAGVKAALSV